MAGRNPVSMRVPCERARHWASLRLDGELSALEAELLERHLGSCDDCGPFATRLRLTTSALRETPLELPERRIRIPARRVARLPLEGRRTALVAAAALVVGAVT